MLTTTLLLLAAAAAAVVALVVGGAGVSAAPSVLGVEGRVDNMLSSSLELKEVHLGAGLEWVLAPAKKLPPNGAITPAFVVRVKKKTAASGEAEAEAEEEDDSDKVGSGTRHARVVYTLPSFTRVAVTFDIAPRFKGLGATFSVTPSPFQGGVVSTKLLGNATEALTGRVYQMCDGRDC